MTLIDGLDGERWNIELVSDEKLAEMNEAYRRYTDDSWGRDHGDWMRASHQEILDEIAARSS